ncbi:MAG: tRNA lysidine(34) synthetase TilS [Candidatus Saccharimonadales bacterium]
MIKVNLPAGKYVVAVSGGVDSTVLLDVLSKLPNLELIVAHFDHGIRQESSDDEIFVSNLADKYGLQYESRRENLGEKASEDLARKRRYLFLNEIADKYQAKLITAHHGDDVIETIAINVIRGTGWRGLAVMDLDIIRPMTHIMKSEIINYAKCNNLDWREDITNNSDDYLRNKIRRRTMPLDLDTKLQILMLWEEQKIVKKEIDREVNNINKDNSQSRYFFININPDIALELLRGITKGTLTRPQLINLLHAIKTFDQNKTYDAGNGIKIHFSSRNFTVELLK